MRFREPPLAIFLILCYNAFMKREKTKNKDGENIPEVRYYKSFNEDFDGGDMRERVIDGSYRYERKNVFYRLWSWFLYRCVAAPCAFLYTKLKFRERYVGKDKLKPYRRVGYFIFGNHTQPVADAFTPNMLGYPKRCHVVISSKNFSLPVLGPVLPELGGIPTPTERSAIRPFARAIEDVIAKGRTVAIYPEAHLWPYCSFIRPFSDVSFDYPVRCNAPSFSFTRVYKRRGKRGVRCEIYIDGPFFPDESISPREARAGLRDKVYSAMQKRAELNEVEVVSYEEEPR